MRRIAAAALCLLLASTPAAALDGFAVTVGQAQKYGNHEPIENGYLARITGIQNRYAGRDVPGKDWRSSSFWEFDLGYWSWDDKRPGGKGDLWEVAATPVFRLERSKPLHEGLDPFFEIGVGAHLISETVVSSRQLSTNFHFGSFVGAGFEFWEHYDAALRIQHLSNAGIRTPNPGINFFLLKIGYRY